MKQQLKMWAGALALSAALGMVSSGVAQAGPLDGVLGKVVKVGGIGFLVKQFGPQINKVINTLLIQKGDRYDGKTKVVPTFALGNGAYIGGAQVQGEEAQVDEVKYVATVEVPLGSFRGKAYFPVKSLIKGSAITKPVKGTGVSALVDFKI
ncbi:MAG: Uncharacterized protein K0Q72_2245 [Armatimonadetes bacterium]|nr:Uncharacterized protein [Armatimonadota bacterium]